MKRKWLATAAALLIAGQAAAKGNGTDGKEEGIGIGSGAAVGALAGGPVGLILGAALGAWAGDRYHEERTQRRAAERKFAEARSEAALLQAQLDGSERELASERAGRTSERRELMTKLEDAIEVQVYFRTAESALGAATQHHLAQLAGLLNGLDDFSIVVDGHADSRGDPDYNDQLSAERAAAVRDALLSAGIAPERIVTYASGETESTAAETDPDALALERKVDLKIVRGRAQERVARANGAVLP